MNLNEIRRMAKSMGVNSYKMKKAEIIQAIQRAEHNIDCYGTQRVGNCNEDTCLWRNDCLPLSHQSDNQE